MKTLHITVRDKIATYMKRDGEIVCANGDYQIEFDFDSEWDAYNEKVARFIWNGDYFDMEFTDNICPVPIIDDTTECLVGVYAGELSTTTPAKIECLKSILCGSSIPKVENDKMYTNEAKEAADRAEDAAERAEEIAGNFEAGTYFEADPTVPAWAKAPSKPRYTAIEVGARPDDWTPTETDPTVPDWAKAPTPPTESDPTVPAWAKQAEKPAYAWDEITDKPFTDGKLNPSCLPDGLGSGTSGGGNTVITLTSADDLNHIRQSGWYAWSDSVPANAPDMEGMQSYGYMRVDAYLDTHTVTQTVWNTTTSKGCEIKRQIRGNTVYDWEWSNPPMTVGVEYRTTERWMGKSVFVILLDCGHPTDGKTVRFDVPSSATMLRFHGTMNTAAMPWLMDRTSLAAKLNAYFYVTRGVVYIKCGDSIGGPDYTASYQMHCCVWYTKD